MGGGSEQLTPIYYRTNIGHYCTHVKDYIEYIDGIVLDDYAIWSEEDEEWDDTYSEYGTFDKSRISSFDGSYMYWNNDVYRTSKFEAFIFTPTSSLKSLEDAGVQYVTQIDKSEYDEIIESMNG